jgi:type IV pilus assembly protein PilC
MPIYKYTAKNENGETLQGKVEAKTKNQAATALMNRKLLVIDIRPISEGSWSYLQSKIFGVKQDDLVNFTRQLATMINAGLPLSSALSILQEQSNAAMSSVVTKVLKDVEGGKSLAGALKEHPDIFNRVYIQLVRAGEAGGVLDSVLQRLADTLEKQKDFRAKTKSAMIYPVIVLVAMVVVAFIMMVFVMPQLTQMYQEFEAELPLPTKVLISVSNFMAQFWWVFIGGTIAAVLGLRTWSKTEQGEKAIDQFILKLPVVGVLRKKLVLTEFSRTLALLITAGVSLLESLDIVSEALDSISFREVISQAKDEVEKGVSLSQALEVHDIFPPILPQMVSVGEETGRIDEILEKLSEYYEKESEYAVKNLTTMMEPMIMIILGVGVGFMAISIIMPIYNLTDQF